MKLKSGLPFSLIKHGLPYDYPQLDKDLRTDVLIMGGGISGALTAHYLVDCGINCTIVDARSIGLGSTCASTSLLQYEIDVPLHQLILQRGEYAAVRSYELCLDSIQHIEKIAEKIGFKEISMTRSLYFAAYKKDREFIEKEFKTRKRYQMPVKLLAEMDIKKEFGINAPNAILSNMAAALDAYRFTHELCQYNIKRGLSVYDRTPVCKIRHEKRNVHLTTANGFRINAKKLVYATGYEVTQYINEPIVKLKSTYAIISESLNTAQQFGHKETLIWNTANPYLYMRNTPDRRFLIGGRDEPFYSPVKRDKLIAPKSKLLEKDFKKTFPHLPFTTEFSWTGTFGSTKDGLPYIGTYPKLPNSYFALGFGGNGITFSQVAGEIIADLLRGKKNADADLFGFGR